MPKADLTKHRKLAQPFMQRGSAHDRAVDCHRADGVLVYTPVQLGDRWFILAETRFGEFMGYVMPRQAR